MSDPSKSSKNYPPTELKIRRTERVRRGKPKFYDPLEYEKHKKKVSRQKMNNKPTQFNSLRNGKPKVYANPPPKGLHLKAKKKKEKVEEPKEEDLEEIVLSEETLAKFSLILDEINRKIYASSWKC